MDLSVLPPINAALNATATILLVIGRGLARRGEIERHRFVMIGAFVVSSLFLLLYVSHKVSRSFENTTFNAEGWAKLAYLALLGSHVLLAMTVPVFAIRLIVLGMRGDRERHRRLARIGWPIWIYVSITGVLIYLLLYPFNPAPPDPVSASVPAPVSAPVAIPAAQGASISMGWSLSRSPRPSEVRTFGPRSRRELEGVAVATSRSRNTEIGPKARASRPRGYWDRLLGSCPARIGPPRRMCSEWLRRIRESNRCFEAQSHRAALSCDCRLKHVERFGRRAAAPGDPESARRA